MRQIPPARELSVLSRDLLSLPYSPPSILRVLLQGSVIGVPALVFKVVGSRAASVADQAEHGFASLELLASVDQYTSW